MSESVEGVWDDVQEAIRWKPVLPLLRATREAKATPEKMAAIRDLAAFVLRQLTDKDPYTSPAFTTFALVVELTKTDDRVRATIERILPR